MRDFDITLRQKEHAAAGIVLPQDLGAGMQAGPATGVDQLPYFRFVQCGQHPHALESGVPLAVRNRPLMPAEPADFGQFQGKIGPV